MKVYVIVDCGYEGCDCPEVAYDSFEKAKTVAQKAFRRKHVDDLIVELEVV